MGEYLGDIPLLQLTAPDNCCQTAVRAGMLAYHEKDDRQAPLTMPNTAAAADFS